MVAPESTKPKISRNLSESAVLTRAAPTPRVHAKTLSNLPGDPLRNHLAPVPVSIDQTGFTNAILAPVAQARAKCTSLAWIQGTDHVCVGHDRARRTRVQIRKLHDVASDCGEVAKRRVCQYTTAVDGHCCCDRANQSPTSHPQASRNPHAL